MVISSELTCTFSCVVITIYQVGCGSSIMTPHFIFDSLWLNLIRKVREVSHQFWLLSLFLCLQWSTSTLFCFCSCVFIHTLIKISEKGNFLFVFNYMWDSVSLLLHYMILSPSYFLGCHVPPHPSETLQHHSLHHRQRAPARLLQR